MMQCFGLQSCYMQKIVWPHGYFINCRCGCFFIPIIQYVGKVEQDLLLIINMRILLICKCNEPTINKGRAYQVKEELIATKTHIDQIAFSIL
jgi:hypothetical protein